MKIEKIILIVGLMLLFLSFCPTALKDKLYGKWEYQYSIFDTVRMKIEIDKECPVQKMIFINCDDKEKMKQLPVIVQNLRKNNLLENYCCKTFNNNELIDEYFPVIQAIEISGKSLYIVNNYGYRYKTEYFIEKIYKDTLVIFNDKTYIVDNKQHTFVRHIYFKKTGN